MDDLFLSGTYKNSLNKIIALHGVFPMTFYLLKYLSHAVTSPLN
jgi:hypothetical protein